MIILHDSSSRFRYSHRLCFYAIFRRNVFVWPICVLLLKTGWTGNARRALSSLRALQLTISKPQLGTTEVAGRLRAIRPSLVGYVWKFWTFRSFLEFTPVLIPTPFPAAPLSQLNLSPLLRSHLPPLNLLTPSHVTQPRCLSTYPRPPYPHLKYFLRFSKQPCWFYFIRYLTLIGFFRRF